MVLEIYLYSYQGDVNVINKELESIIIYPLRVKKSIDILNPNIKLQSDLDLINVGCNYAYITSFERYYFVNEISPYPNDIYELELQVDVLETYKEDILAGEGRLMVSNKLGYTGNIDMDVRKQATIYESDVTLDDVSNILITTVGD